ncbi:MAG: hypothetical protein LBV69_05600 [Bacteroidales bacterium]|jgi:hypothetical protein|nr:hypothetical protein [Bacteroidales bacterium]
MTKKLIIILILSNFTFISFAQYDKIFLYSNKKTIEFNINGGKNDWIISQQAEPDIYSMYNKTGTNYHIKFISDVDSLEFDLKTNTAKYFSIIYNNDTVKTGVELSDQIKNSLNDNEKIFALSLLWEEIKYNFAFIDKITFDIDSLYKEYISQVISTKNDYELYKILRRFTSCFKDAHTQVVFSKTGTYTNYSPLSLKYFGKDLCIISVREDLEKTFPLGSKILEINNLQTDTYIKKFVEPYLYSDVEITKKNMVAYYLCSSRLDADTLIYKYQTPNGEIRKNIVPNDGNTKMGNYLGYKYKYPRKNVEITWLKDSIAVLIFNTFSELNGKNINDFESIKDSLYLAKGIIVDIRQNGGGSTSVAWHLLQYIVKDSYFLNFAWQTRINNGVKRATGNFKEENKDYYNLNAYETFLPDTIYISDTIKRFNVPLVILISNNTASAAEDFLIDLYEIPNRPLLIGQPTLGSTGSPLMVWGFPLEGYARVCARRVLYPYSLKPFTEGVMPDIFIDYSFNEYMSQEDKEIERAIIEIKKLLK